MPADIDFVFHFTSAWRDVQEKAKRIKDSGQVRIISSSPAFLVGEIGGDTNIYQTTLMREPGSQRIALWECGCAWAAYSWGRSGRWKKYEGRVCSHALALNYEGQARGWGGQQIHEDMNLPQWRSDPTLVVQLPGDYKKPNFGEWRFDSAKRISTDASLQEAPAMAIAREMFSEGARPSEVHTLFQKAGVFNAPNIINNFYGAPRKEAISGNRLKWKMTSPGEYTATYGDHQFDITHRVIPDDGSGYGRRDDWVVRHTGPYSISGYESFDSDSPSDPVQSLWMAKEDAESLLDIFLEGKVGVKQAQADSEDGCMIALRPPDHILEQVWSGDGEEWENLHLTLAYLGKSEEINHEVLETAVAEWAERWFGFPGQLSGYGVFENGDDRVLHASIDVPGLDRARDDLVDTLALYGIALPDDHGFDPHLTLAYGDVTAPESMSDEAKEEFTFTEVYVAYGQDWIPFSFDVEEIEVEAELKDEPEPALPETTAEEDDDEEIQPGDPRLSWLMSGSGRKKGGDDMDISAAARAHLAKESVKTFSIAEQQELIEEGEGVMAGNLDRLNISGTHYEPLEEAYQMVDGDEDWLW